MQSQNRPSEPEAEKKDGFVMLPRWLYESPLLSGNERLFCLSLAYHRNNRTHLCCPGRPTICREASITENTYYSIRGRLKRIGLIDYEESVGGRKHYVEFILKWLDGSKEEKARLKAILKGKKPPQKNTGLGTINPPKRTQVNPPKRTQLTIINSNNKKEKEEEQQQEEEKEKSAVAVSSSFSPFSEETTLINQTAKLGIPEKKAKSLLVRYGKSALRNQLDWLPQRENINYPAGAFITALKENWPEPVKAGGAKRRGKESDKYKRVYTLRREDQEKMLNRAKDLFKRKGDCGDLRTLLSKLDNDYKEEFREWERDHQYEGLED